MRHIRILELLPRASAAASAAAFASAALPQDAAAPSAREVPTTYCVLAHFFVLKVMFRPWTRQCCFHWGSFRLLGLNSLLFLPLMLWTDQAPVEV